MFLRCQALKEQCFLILIEDLSSISSHQTRKNCLLNIYRGDNAAEMYANDVADIILKNTCGKVAGYIAEPTQGAGGFYPLPYGYLERVYDHVHKAGGLCISDEV